ncbi:MAG: type II toxin-antitoxin system VapC family toxin [Acidobacteria bacterium]|nr:PIN domain-containing protein [Acidobacteriota bacterium]MXW71908.1 type II toxin-antitoxin system VapC family toxin [Acidobacteriota bacterium]MYE44381.1 type II toxin-antitoxin system VapC family toxin [Acidobacteriota bacterium]
MIRFCCDTNVLIAACCPWHDHHDPSRREIDRRRSGGEEMVVAAHSVIEMYSVLTRIPRWRMSPEDASTLIRSNLEGVPDIQLPTAEVWKALEQAAQFGIRGGRIHDALIARCAIRGGASTLLTWNRRDFTLFAGEIQLLRPAP